VLVSDLAQQKQIHWLKIVLEGATSNRNGLGATVRVRTGAIPTRNTTTASQDIWRKAPYRFYFGLGDTDKIERVEVDWPSGRKQVLTSKIDANQTLRITEPTR
jgi:hypothetical protein